MAPQQQPRGAQRLAGGRGFAEEQIQPAGRSAPRSQRLQKVRVAGEARRVGFQAEPLPQAFRQKCVLGDRLGHAAVVAAGHSNVRCILHPDRLARVANYSSRIVTIDPNWLPAKG